MSQRDARPPERLLSRLRTRLGGPFASERAGVRSTQDTADGQIEDRSHLDGDAERAAEQQSERNGSFGESATRGSPRQAATSAEQPGTSVPKISTLVPDGTVNRRALWRRGGARGFQHKPAQDTRSLDSVEERVVARCERVLEKAIDVHRDTVAAYCSNVARLHQKTITGVPEAPKVQADLRDLARGCQDRLRQVALIAEQSPYEMLEADLKRVVDGSKRDLPVLAQDEEGGIGPTTESGDRNADGVVSRLLSTVRNWKWPFLACLILAETVINGWFFSNNMIVQSAGWTEALLISAVNILALAPIAAFVIHLWRRRPVHRFWTGALGLTIAIPTVLFHLGVAHYRDAMPPNYPPSPVSADAGAAGVGSFPPEVVACYRGNAFDAASAEAMCLLTSRPLALLGIKSWFFWLLGMTLWGLAVRHILNGQTGREPPGPVSDSNRAASGETGDADVFGNGESSGTSHTEADLPRRRGMVFRAAQRILANTLKGVSILRDDAMEKLRWDPGDLLAQREGIGGQQACLQELRGNLEKDCRNGIAAYRKANLEARGECPAPDHWAEPWESDWSVPKLEEVAGFPDREEVERYLAKEKEANATRIRDVQEAMDTTVIRICDHYADFATVMGGPRGRDRRTIERILKGMGLAPTPANR